MTRGAFAIARGNLLDKKKKKTERSAHGHRVLHPLNLPASPLFFFIRLMFLPPYLYA